MNRKWLSENELDLCGSGLNPTCTSRRRLHEIRIKVCDSSEYGYGIKTFLYDVNKYTNKAYYFHFIHFSVRCMLTVCRLELVVSLDSQQCIFICNK